MAFEALKDLIGRRVPHILGIYLGASWVIVEFVNLLVDRFSLSPHLIAFSLVALASLIPTVGMLAYFHGRPGRNEWATTEKIGIPVNLLVAVVLVGFLFSDKHLGAATTTVTLETEEGQTIERVIPKSEFRKKVAMFNFENESGNPELDWLSWALVYGLEMDLSQDFYIHFADLKGQHEQLERAGYPQGIGLPRTLQANIAGQLHRDYFITGSFREEGGALSATASVYETRRQKRLARSTFTGEDVLNLIDRMSVQLRRDLGIPERHIEETADLRIADLLTHSRQVFRLQAEALNGLLRNDWTAVRTAMERAVEEDPTSAFSHYFLSAAYLVANRKQEADQAARQMMKYIYRLPEPWQYYVKYYYYEVIEPDVAKRFAVAKMTVDLYPEDIEARVQLAREYSLRNQTEKAVAEYEHILKLDPTQHEYLRAIGYLYRDAGRDDKALDHFQRYVKAVPGDYAAFLALGDLYCSQGDHERGESQYERALVIDPDNVEVLNRLATAAYNLGRLEESRRLHERALVAAKTARERAEAYGRLSYHHQARHQLTEAIEYKELEWVEREKYMPRPVVVINHVLGAVDLYAMVDREDRALEIIRAAEDELVEPFSWAIPFAYLEVYLALDDAERAAEALTEAEAVAEKMQAGWVRDDLFAARGWIQELQGDYEAALQSYKEALKLEPQDVSRHRFLGRCYRLLGRLEEAKAELEKNLRVTPYNPKSHYEIALLYVDMGDRARAIEHLRTALQVLDGAYPGCETAQKASSKLAELEAT